MHLAQHGSAARCRGTEQDGPDLEAQRRSHAAVRAAGVEIDVERRPERAIALRCVLRRAPTSPSSTEAVSKAACRSASTPAGRGCQIGGRWQAGTVSPKAISSLARRDRHPAGGAVPATGATPAKEK